MTDTPLRDALNAFLAEFGRITGQDVEEIVLSPRSYKALNDELGRIATSYGGKWNACGFPEIKFSGVFGVTRIRPHIREIDENR